MDKPKYDMPIRLQEFIDQRLRYEGGGDSLELAYGPGYVRERVNTWTMQWLCQEAEAASKENAELKRRLDALEKERDDGK